MASPTKRVAVIGAGVSGLTSARHLRKAGLDVVVYERSKKTGGNWVYDERQPIEPSYPAITPSVADFIPEDGSKSSDHNQKGFTTLEEDELQFAPTSPAYSGLTNNVSTKLQQLKDFPWKEGTPDYINVRQKEEYLQSYAQNFDIIPLIRFNTRVEKLQKIGQKWQVSSTTLVVNGPDRGKRLYNVEEFDNVVVASGHYHASKVPDIPGLKEWKAAWPKRVQHSKAYRHPDEFRNQSVLLVGAGTSSTDIARETFLFARKVYQSSRGGAFDIPQGFLPKGIDRIPGISSFSPPKPGQKTPGSVTLTDGTVLTDIDRVVICTGYHFALPFLLPLHSDTTLPQDADDTILVTDGTMLHNLHLDIFYIPDPSLAFVGVPFYTATYTFFEYQAIAVAAVLSGKAWLPSEEVMKTEYKERVQSKGYGRNFHSLREKEVEYVSDLVAWLNKDAEQSGAEKVEPHSEEWILEKSLFFVKIRGFFDEKDRSIKRELEAENIANGGLVGTSTVQISAN